MNQPLSHILDPATSYKAADRMVKSGELELQEIQVLDAIILFIKLFGMRDFTAKEISIEGSVSYHTIQRRLSGLRNKGYIERISINNNGNPPWKKRNGCCVYKRLK